MRQTKSRPAFDYDTIDFPFELKSLDDEGKLEGYAAVFNNLDLVGDVIEPGAFTKTIQETDGQVPVLYQHDRYEPIGISSELTQDRKGLYVKGQLNMEVQRARETRALLNQGAMQGLSIGYKTIKKSFEGGARRLKELGLKEFSPVTFPANPLAVASVKAAGEVVWQPESGFYDLLSDLVELLNPGAPPNRLWVSDINIDLTAAIVQDYNGGQAWVVPIAVDDEGTPSIAPSNEWIAAESAWVATEDDEGDGKSELVVSFARARAVLLDRPDKLNTVSRTALADTQKHITALLEQTEPDGKSTPDGDGAADDKETPAYLATFRDSLKSLKPEE